AMYFVQLRIALPERRGRKEDGHQRKLNVPAHCLEHTRSASRPLINKVNRHGVTTDELE
ncbi:hypothetical protein AVEN_241773-1, partial [Araneus ventricosus]